MPPPPLPVPQLESLKFKTHQLLDSITSLHRTLDGHPHYIPAWPDILSKYNILLSQSLNFSNALLAPSAKWDGVALHPSTGMSDAQLDAELAPLLRNQQTTDVLKAESETVRRFAGHIARARGAGAGAGAGEKDGGVDHEEVLRECADIRAAHDRRVERAQRAVVMLREKFDWKLRMEVDVEEPEELEWDPRLTRPLAPPVEEVEEEEEDDDEEGDEDAEGEGEEDDEEDVQMSILDNEH
jgi:hypothetical protein